MNWTNFKKIYNMSEVNDWFKKEFQRVDSDNDNSSEPKSDISVNENEVEVLTEDKFDKDIIPTTKLVGMISSGLIGLLMIFNGSWLAGLLYAAGGVMATLGLCVLLEGISTIIKLLRKISEK